MLAIKFVSPWQREALSGDINFCKRVAFALTEIGKCYGERMVSRRNPRLDRLRARFDIVAGDALAYERVAAEKCLHNLNTVAAMRKRRLGLGE